MITEQERKRRRLMARLIQLVLIVVAVGIGVAFVAARRGDRSDVDFDRGTTVVLPPNIPAPTQLGPGDMQLLNASRSVDLILRDRTILVGLSPQTVERIKTQMRERGSGDSSGLGGMIATTVRNQVADKIGTHISYDIDDIADIRLEDERLVIDWNSGKQQQLFESVKIDNDRGNTNRFVREEALRFIELVKARQRQPTP
jgi:hypothetical protein